MNGSSAASAPMRPITAAAAGPCSASRARSSCGMKLHAGGQVGGDMSEVDLLAAGVHHQEQPLAAEIRHHQVVEDAARLVGQQRVALPARLQPQHVAGHQPLQRGRRGGAGQRRLAHVRDIEQRRLRPAVQMLGQHALVLHRHGVAGERHHPGAETRGARRRAASLFSGLGVGSSGSAFSITGPLRKGHAPALGAGVADPPLSRYLKDSGRARAPLTSSVRQARGAPAGFPEIPDPAAVPVA